MSLTALGGGDKTSKDVILIALCYLYGLWPSVLNVEFESDSKHKHKFKWSRILL